MLLLQYKCPNCGDDMAFDSDSGTLACGSCGRQDNIETFDDAYVTQKFSEEDVKEYHCHNCGASVMTDQDTTATSCSFCGAGVVLGDRLVGDLAPGKVIPFTISKDEAREAFRKWCKNGRFTPKGFMHADRIKNISGMYIPFWMYDFNTNVTVDAVGTRVRTYSRGDYIYTETKFYEIYRDMDIYYKKVPTDASEKMDDLIMDKLEPYHYKDLKAFKTPYLAGYLAEKYNFDAKALEPRVEAKVSPYTASFVGSTMSGYSSIRNRNERSRTRHTKSTYVLLPIWMVYYDFDKQEHTFAMNGQTGKVVGKPPISKMKLATWMGSIAMIVFAVLKSVAFVMGGVLW